MLIDADGLPATVIEPKPKPRKKFIKLTKRIPNPEDMEILTDGDPMPFGEFKGRSMCEVPAEYLLKLKNYRGHSGVRDYVMRMRDALILEAS